MKEMFTYSPFNGNISNWDVSALENMEEMFAYSAFSGDLSEWDVSNVENTDSAFDGTELEDNPPWWI
jgi:hypothetical protein